MVLSRAGSRCYLSLAVEGQQTKKAKVQHGEALDISDLEQLAQKAVPDPVTIDYVRLTRAAYTLRAAFERAQYMRAITSYRAPI